MKRFSSLFAALLGAASLAAVPVANAQNVHFVGAGSSAMFQGFGVAAYNDLATPIVTANPGFTAHHWSEKSSNTPGTWAGAVDSRTPSGGTPPPVEYGNIWVVWVDNASGTPTDIWADLSVDSTVGNRTYLAAPRAKLLLASADTSQPGVNAIASSLFVGGTSDDAFLDPNVYNALGGATGISLTAGLTDIRPEDALLATNRILGTVPAGGFPTGVTNACPPQDTGVPGAASPTCSDYPYFYAFALGYGNSNPLIGTQILSSQSSTAATPVAFGLPGFSDPITGTAVSGTIKVFPVGESPIIFIANRTNASGLGQVIGSLPNCGTTNAIGCVSGQGSGGFTSDGSYYVRNLWDQHPYPATTVFPSTTEPTTGYCSVPANAGTAECHITRRPLGNLFAGNLCEGRNTAFSWPLDPALEGARTIIPNGTDFPVNLVVREPLSGTYSTVEYSEIRRFGNTQGSMLKVSGLFGKPPYISQESNIQIANPNNNPLKIACQAGFGDTDTEGIRYRAIGTGEEASTVQNTKDSIGYLFFSFGNVSKIAASPSYGYLMIDGIDPLFADYENNAGNPGQPASPSNPLSWGELPKCTPGGTPNCSTSAIWTGSSYPHLRDGTYPAWSELRMICDTADAHCTTSSDSNGAEALVQNLQWDIHNQNLGGVPDLLPFADGGVATFGNGQYGDAGFVRSHYSFMTANDNDEFNNIAPYSNATQQTTHQANALVNFGGSSVAACPTANEPVNGPTPTSECGGDAGGFVIAAPPASGASNGQLQ